MGTILKLLAVVLVVGGIWVWTSGRSITNEQMIHTTPAGQLSASAFLATAPEYRPFDQRGTIIIDETQGQGGTSYLLYTEYSEAGKPRIMTKRLVFSNQDACADVNLPCATNQPGTPVRTDEEVRVVGRTKNELVEVGQVYRL